MLAVILLVFDLISFLIHTTVASNESFARHIRSSASMGRCLALWGPDLTTFSIDETIFDMTCFNNDGKLESNHYYHVIINCLVPMAPTIAMMINATVSDSHTKKKKAQMFTNAMNLNLWIRFLVPHAHVETSKFSITGFAGKRIVRQPTINLSSVYYSEYQPCVHFLRELGFMSLRARLSNELTFSGLSTIKILLIHRLKNSRDIRNWEELKKQFADSHFNASLVTFEGNEDKQTTFLHFSTADIVIGYHGAGFSNVVFCRPTTTIVELSTWLYGDDYCCPEFEYRKYVGWRSNRDIAVMIPVNWCTVFIPFSQSGFVRNQTLSPIKAFHIPDMDHFVKTSSLYLMQDDIEAIFKLIEAHVNATRTNDLHRSSSYSWRDVVVGTGSDLDVYSNFGSCSSRKLRRI